MHVLRTRLLIRQVPAKVNSTVLSSLAGLFLAVCSSGLHALQFDPGFNAQWTFSKLTSSTGDQCVLTQEIPGYGTARFQGSPGLGLRFELSSHRDLFGSGGVMAVAQAPEWHPAWPDVYERGYLQHIDGGPIAAEEPVATTLLMDLRQGRALTLTSQSRYGSEDEIVAATISPLRFDPAYSALMHCHQWSMPANYGEVAKSHIHFEQGQLSLPATARARLDLLARYVLADRLMTGIFIDGHADQVGKEQANLKLSERRARLVADHLVQRGIPRNLLRVRFHGSRDAVATGDTAAANDANRRVTVRLERHETALASSAR